MVNKQLSLFLENKSGRLAEVTRIIADVGVDILAMAIADTTSFGILRLIVDDIDKAAKALEEHGLAFKITDVVAIEVPDRPGGLADALQIVDKAEIGIEYMYAFIGKNSTVAHVILKITDADRAIEVFKKNDIKVISSAFIADI